MSLKYLLLYAVTVLIASITPGPSMLLALNHGIKYGVKRTLGTALGNVAATLIQAVLSIFGLTAVLLRSATVFSVIKYLGAGYLLVIGFRMIFSAVDGIHLSLTQTPEKEFWDLFTEAFGVTAGNPKAIIFFTALFPQFITPGTHTFFQSSIIVVILLTTTFICMMIYGLFGQKITFMLNRPRLRKSFNSLIGVTFVGMGIGLATGKIDT